MKLQKNHDLLPADVSGFFAAVPFPECVPMGLFAALCLILQAAQRGLTGDRWDWWELWE